MSLQTLLILAEKPPQMLADEDTRLRLDADEDTRLRFAR